MEDQFQNNQVLPQEVKTKHKKKFVCIFLANIIVTIVVSVLVVSFMEADLRSDVKEIQEKVKHIKIGK